MFISFLKILFFSLLIFLFLSCSNSSNSQTEEPQASYTNFAILGPLSASDVNISSLDSNKTLFATKTNSFTQTSDRLKWGKYSVGSFNVHFDENISLSNWVITRVTNGEDIDKNDDGIVDNLATYNSGVLKLYSKVGDFNSSTLIVNAFTSIAALMYEQNASANIELFLNNFAKDIFRESVDGFAGVDYRDLFAYVPNHTQITVLHNPNIYDNLILYGFMDALLADANLTQMLNGDLDGDTLSFWDEMLHNSNPTSADGDGDGINDADEIARGLNPISSDSDSDSLNDFDEINLHFTDPLKADSDDDFLPDALEIVNGSNPLDADENNNNIMDGLDGDPFFQYQWYIKSLGTDIVNTASVSTILGNDLNILDTYHYVLGSNGTKEISIQVIDSGVAAHEDLVIDRSLSLNAINHTNDPSPTKALTNDPYSPADIGHGNAVAGIIAARANNGLGIRGLAPYAKIAGSNWLEDEGIIELEKVWYSQIDSSEILVSNNSWGIYILQDFTYEEILARASTELRDSKGRVFVFASGNFRKDFGNANLSYLSNNPYAITVASLNHKDTYSIYSSPGSNILVSAYGGEYYYVAPTIMSTLLMGESYYESELIGKKGSITIDEDSNRNYTYVMNGTSAAAPMVSAAIALTLEACPSLTYRDIKWILAYTSKKIDTTNSTWVKNSAGLWHNIDYGYGKVDTLGMVNLCRSKYFRPLPPLKIENTSLTNINKYIPDTNTSLMTEIYFDKELKVEWLGLTLDINHPFAGDLEINLISPQGTKTTIMTLTETRNNAYNGGFRFGSVAFVDEDALGIWKVEIIDRLADDSGTLKSIKLEIHGYEK